MLFVEGGIYIAIYMMVHTHLVPPFSCATEESEAAQKESIYSASMLRSFRFPGKKKVGYRGKSEEREL